MLCACQVTPARVKLAEAPCCAPAVLHLLAIRIMLSDTLFADGVLLLLLLLLLLRQGE
jgi:hypothetical protein